MGWCSRFDGGLARLRVWGNSDPNMELLDAGVVVGHLVPAGSVYAFLAGVVMRCLLICSRLTGAAPRYRPMDHYPVHGRSSCLVRASEHQTAIDAFRLPFEVGPVAWFGGRTRRGAPRRKSPRSLAPVGPAGL